MTEASGLFVESNIEVVYPDPNSVTFVVNSVTKQTLGTNPVKYFTTYKGVVTVIGENVYFYARAIMGTPSAWPQRSQATISIKLNDGTILSTDAVRMTSPGYTDSPYLPVVTAGVYEYTLVVFIQGSECCGHNGEIKFIQQTL
jgi:hypothetical protein